MLPRRTANTNRHLFIPTSLPSQHKSTSSHTSPSQPTQINIFSYPPQPTQINISWIVRARCRNFYGIQWTQIVGKQFGDGKAWAKDISHYRRPVRFMCTQPERQLAVPFRIKNCWKKHAPIVSIGLAVSLPTRPRHLGAPSSQIWCSKETPPQKTRQYTRDTLTWLPYFSGPMGASNYPSDFWSDISSDFASDFSSDFPSDFFPVSSPNVQFEGKAGVIQFFIRFSSDWLLYRKFSMKSTQIGKNWRHPIFHPIFHPIYFYGFYIVNFQWNWRNKNWIENWMENWMTHWNAYLDEHFVAHWSIHCRTHWRTRWYNVREGPQRDSRPVCCNIDFCVFCVYLIVMRYTYESVGFRIFVQWFIVLSSHDL